MIKTITSTIFLLMLFGGSYAQINVFPNTTNFESEGLCGTSCAGTCNFTGVWRNGDQFGFVQAGTDWLAENGPTPSTATGPDIDHTLGTALAKYAYVETSGCNNTTAHLVSDVYDFSALSAPKISFWYHMLGATMGTMSLDVDSSGLGNWDLNIVPSWTDNIDLWQFKEISLIAYAGKPNVRIRIRANTGTSFTSDMAVDDITVFEPVQNDLTHASVIAGGGCGNSNLTPVIIQLVNTGVDTIDVGTSIPVSFKIGVNVVTDTIITAVPYLANDTFSYTFVNGFADLSGPGAVVVDSWVNWDLLTANDSSTVTTQGIPVISTFPYFENFESGQNGWVINNGGTGSWAFGTPAKTTINTAGSGVNSFVTGGLLTGFYNDNDISYVQGPCFDFTNICDPVISLKVWWNAEFSWDGMNVTYSTDGGTIWNLVGAFGDPNNWYTDNTIVGAPGGSQSGWSGRISTANGSAGWVTARHRIVGTGGNPNVKIRINFGSDGSVTDDGVAFDDIKIYNSMDLGPDQLVCGPAIVPLDAYEGNPTATYSWSNGAITASTTVDSTNTYVVTMTDGACVVSDSIYVLITNPNTQVNLGNDTSLCVGSLLLLDAGNWPQSSYVWSNASTDRTITVATSSSYYVAVTNICGTYNDTINVLFTEPTVSASATPSTTCNNTSVLPTGSGAMSYTWSGGLVDGLPFIATATDTYTVTGTDGNSCTATSSVTVTVNPSSGNLAPSTSNHTQTHGDDFNINYYDGSCNLIASVDDGNGGNVLGLTTTTVNVDATANFHNGQPFVRRWYQITPNSNGSADVVLYINQSDFDDYNNVLLPPYQPLPTSGSNLDPNIPNIRITKNDDAGLGNNPIVITPTVNWNGNYWELSFNTPSFSQFRIHGANANNAPLPMVLKSFDGKKLVSSDELTWTTNSESNNAYFNLQHSTDGVNFETIAKVNSKAINGNSSTDLQYHAVNNHPVLGHNYYRLQQIDIDNKSSVHAKMVDLIWGANGSTVNIYPNPTRDMLNIDLYTSTELNTTVKVLDMSGRIIKQVQVKSVAGMNNIAISLGEFTSGLYTIQVYENNKLMQTSKVRKNN
ncbi:MAG: T9SS type A sorting domain-containing protein [Bacteroidetes bacterium]|nr:T9SS type A sorting domain-containing protein [Bacteroidota bacterium]